MPENSEKPARGGPVKPLNNLTDALLAGLAQPDDEQDAEIFERQMHVKPHSGMEPVDGIEDADADQKD